MDDNNKLLDDEHDLNHNDSDDINHSDDLDHDGNDDDRLKDSGSDDNWFGGLGHDEFHGGRGDDHIDGGDDIDEAHYESDHDNYTITKTATGLEINDDVGTDGHDVLSNVERLNFADTSLAFDIEGNAGQAYRLYEAAFNREADSEGLGFWINSLDSGASLLDIAAGFTHSAEFESLYRADSTNDDFVNTLYNNVLGRQGDSEGHDFWLKLLDDGVSSREQILVEFSESAENQANAIAIIGDTGIDFIPFIA